MKILNIQKLAISISIFFVISALFYVSTKLNFPISYPDFITGYVTLNNGTKFQDLVIMPIVLFGGFIAFSILVDLFTKLNNRNKKESKELAYYVVLWSLPIFSILLNLIAHKKIDEIIFVPFLSILILLTSKYKSIRENTGISVEKISIGLLMTFFLGLLPLSFSILINILPLDLTGGGIKTSEIKQWIITLFSVSLAGYLYCIFFNSKIYDKVLPKLALVSQIGLSILFFRLYPARLLVNDNLIIYHTKFSLKLLILFLFSFSIYDIYSRYKKYIDKNSTSNLISPFAVVALLVFLDMGWISTPTINPDDYHFGEKILGWWTYFHGYLPYLDYMPSHGLISDDIPGILNVIFYDGKASSLHEAGRLASALFTIIGFLSFFKFSKSLLISTIIVYPNAGNLAWLFLFPFIALWFNKILLKNKIKWMITWIITSPLMVLGLPPQGFIFAVSSSIIFLYYIWLMLKGKEYLKLKIVTFSVLIISAIYIITPLGEMLHSAIQYVLINGPINQIAHGIPWSQARMGGLELLRMSWAIVSAIMIFISFYFIKYKHSKIDNILPIIVTIIFAMLLIPYSMGRIEVGIYSRPSSISILLITGFMVPLIWNRFSKYNCIWLIFGAFASTAILKGLPLSLTPLINSANAFVQIENLTDTEGTLLANIGRAIIQKNHLDRLTRLSKVLDKKLNPKESYLDLTSRNAHYFYFDRKPLIPITAAYNMPSPIQQKDAIKRLKNNLPRLALLEAENSFGDSGGFALRNFELYRFIIENYEPFKIDGFIIALSKASINRGDWGSISNPSLEKRIELFEQAFSKKNMNYEKIPISWGRSIDSLSPKMEKRLDSDSIKNSLNHDVKIQKNNNYKVVGNNPSVTFNFKGALLSGDKAGILKYDFACISQPQDTKFQIYWKKFEDYFSEENSLFFTGTNGTLLVPLDSFPKWYLLRDIVEIKLRLLNSESCQEFSVKNISFNQRK